MPYQLSSYRMQVKQYNVITFLRWTVSERQEDMQREQVNEHTYLALLLMLLIGPYERVNEHVEHI